MLWMPINLKKVNKQRTMQKYRLENKSAILSLSAALGILEAWTSIELDPRANLPNFNSVACVYKYS